MKNCCPKFTISVSVFSSIPSEDFELSIFAVKHHPFSVKFHIHYKRGPCIESHDNLACMPRFTTMISNLS
jgi:hypothetical protein